MFCIRFFHAYLRLFFTSHSLVLLVGRKHIFGAGYPSYATNIMHIRY